MRKSKIDIDVISFSMAVIIVMSLFVLVSGHIRAEEPDNQPLIITNSKNVFVLSLDSCITHLYKTLPIEKQIPKELVIAQAAIETGWGKSRFANEGNNLFGIRTWNQDEKHLLPIPWTKWSGWGLKVFETKCDSVADYVRIINEVSAYAEFRELRQDQLDNGLEPDGLILARTLKGYATESHYTDLIEDVIQYNIRGIYKL